MKRATENLLSLQKGEILLFVLISKHACEIKGQTTCNKVKIILGNFRV